LAKSDGLFKSGQNIACLQESIIDLKKKKKSFKWLLQQPVAVSTWLALWLCSNERTTITRSKVELDLHNQKNINFTAEDILILWYGPEGLTRMEINGPLSDIVAWQDLFYMETFFFFFYIVKLLRTLTLFFSVSR